VEGFIRGTGVRDDSVGFDLALLVGFAICFVGELTAQMSGEPDFDFVASWLLMA